MPNPLNISDAPHLVRKDIQKIYLKNMPIKRKKQITSDGYIPEKLLEWRAKKREGTIMKPSTFQKIKTEATKRYGSEARGQAAAGAAYWTTAEAKFRKRKKA